MRLEVITPSGVPHFPKQPSYMKDLIVSPKASTYA